MFNGKKKMNIKLELGTKYATGKKKSTNESQEEKNARGKLWNRIDHMTTCQIKLAGQGPQQLFQTSNFSKKENNFYWLAEILNG